MCMSNYSEQFPHAHAFFPKITQFALSGSGEGPTETFHTMVFTVPHVHALTLRAQFTKSSSLVMTYSPLLLATAAGLAAATAVLFSLTGTTL